MRGQPARRVRRAGTGKPTAETLHGVPSPTQQVQDLDRTQPVLPIDFAKTEKRTHDYVRHGTTNLFAALDTATGEVLGECYQRRRTTEFLTFMDKVAQQYGDREIHVVLDNLSTHKGDDVTTWLTRHPVSVFISRRPEVRG